MRQNPHSWPMPNPPRSPYCGPRDDQIIGIGGMLAFGCLVALAAAVGVGIGLWILADRILTMLGG